MLANFVKETVSAAPLTGDMLLNGKSDAAHIAFGTIYADGDAVMYLAEDGDDRELGVGTYNLTADSITRDTPLETIDSGVFDNTTPAKISLTSATVVHVVSSSQSSGKIHRKYATGIKMCIEAGTTNVYSGFLANTFYAIPFELDSDITITALAMKVDTNPVASSFVRVGIYTQGSDGLPDKLIVESGALDTSTTGAKIGSISSIVIKKGFYFSCMLGSGAIDPTAATGASGHKCLLGSERGEARPVPFATGSQTYGAMPAIAPTTTTTTIGNPPLVWMEE